MKVRFTSKQNARQAVWDRLEAEKLARFPFPPHGRIPNFVGAREAAARLFELEPWKSGRRIKVNPDAPQRFVREEALRHGMTVYVPTPRLRSGFTCLDPSRIPPDKIGRAASLSGGRTWSYRVRLEDLPQMDAIVCGSVAVTTDGHRCGKGEGYSDLEYGILRELGHRPVPVATTVHPVQIVEAFPANPNDLPLCVIVTPDDVIRVKSPLPDPKGIDWSRLSEDDLAAMPVLKDLRDLRRSRNP